MKYNITITANGYEYYREYKVGWDEKAPIARASAVVSDILESFADSSSLADRLIEIRFVKTEATTFRG